MLSKILTFEYVFKTGSEIAWAVLIAVVSTATPIILGSDLATVMADPKTWAMALGAACARAGWVAFMVAVRAVAGRLFGSSE